MDHTISRGGRVDVAAIVAETFAADPAQVLADTRTVVDQLSGLGLLVEAQAG